MTHAQIRLWIACRAALLVALALYDSGAPVAVWCTIMMLVVSSDVVTGWTLEALAAGDDERFRRWRASGTGLRGAAIVCACYVGAV